MWWKRLVAIQLIALLAALPWASVSVVQAQEPITAQSEAAQAAEDRILAILQTSFSGSFRAAPLDNVLADIARSTGLSIQVDSKLLREASIPVDSPVNCELSGVSLRSALGTILEPLDLTWTIHDESLLVTTPEKANNELTTRVYPVHDLVSPPNGSNLYATNGGPLIELITSTIAPTTWDEVGGRGAINYFAPSGSVVISQTREVHEAIEMLLPALRQARQSRDLVAAGRRRHRSNHHRQPAPVDPPAPRYVVMPAAQWAIPRVHE